MDIERPAAAQFSSAMAVFPLVGFAILTRMAFDGVDLWPLWEILTEKIAQGSAHPGEYMDLSLIAQLLGLQQQGLRFQDDILAKHRQFQPTHSSDPSALRVLALAAATDMGGNTPIEFLLEGSAVTLTTLYVVPGTPLPSPLPEHDVAIVVASESERHPGTLVEIDRYAASWPRPLLNLPRLIIRLERDQLYEVLQGIDGLMIPATMRAARIELAKIADGRLALADLSPELSLPLIIRPWGSHAGRGLAKIDDIDLLNAYLAERSEQEFSVSRFVDYASHDGQFRKYRIVAVAGKFFACHMAIAARWDIWYLNAGMLFDAEKRGEEAAFMESFDKVFAARHRQALDVMAERIALDYFTVDCAEDRDGNLVIFEVDHTAVVHNMDPADIYPYKGPKMHAIFEAFSAMLTRASQRQDAE